MTPVDILNVSAGVFVLGENRFMTWVRETDFP
jgi:hypothetical protein